jgi:hypothetical protein
MIGEFKMWLFIVMVIIVIIISFYSDKSHKETIRDEIKYMGGDVINIERCWFGSGPFILKGKGATVYKFEYYLDGKYKIGYVKFGSMLGPKWKL